MINIADQLRKMSMLRPIRVDFRVNERREIGDSEYNYAEEICYKWEQRKRVVEEKGSKMILLVFMLFFQSQKHHICVLMGMVRCNGEN